MAVEVLIPKLGMTMEEGTVAEWLVPDGAEVASGQPLYRLETEKIEMEVEAEGSGTIRRVVEAGAVLPCGGVVALILAPGEAAAPATSPTAAPGTAVAVPAVAAAASAPAAPPAEPGRVVATPAARRVAAERGVDLALVTGTGPGGRVTEEDVQGFSPAAAPAATAAPAASGAEAPASPLARRLAAQLGVDLSTVKGTGPGGRITQEDVEAAAAAKAAPAVPVAAPTPVASRPPSPAPSAAAAIEGEQVRPIRGMRKVIFERMHQSLQSMAQLTMSMEVWMDEAVKLRTQLVEEWAPEGVKPSHTDLVIKAAAKSLRRHPGLNAEARSDGIHLLPAIHVGMAVAVEDGLVVPVIRDADRVSLKEIAAESTRLATAARNNRLTLDEMTGGTFSVTALGMFGVDFFTPIINPPNVAILGVGRIHDGLAWEGERPVRRQLMTLSLTWDHRIVDGAPAAEFLQTVKALLEAPYRLLV